MNYDGKTPNLELPYELEAMKLHESKFKTRREPHATVSLLRTLLEMFYPVKSVTTPDYIRKQNVATPERVKMATKKLPNMNIFATNRVVQ